MKIKILGNGGAINEGLPYNAFVIDNSLLCEAPPDIMLSINTNGMNLSSIKTIYISHLHGDHIFGLPFLILSGFFQHISMGKTFSFQIVGPKGIENMTKQLVLTAFTTNHPCIQWMEKFCCFSEIDKTSQPVLIQGFQTSLFELDHLIETFGFSLIDRKNSIIFAYVADTRWCHSIEKLLKRKPHVVLIDLNGKNNDPSPIHMTIEDLIQKAIPITKESTRYIGTHLKEEFKSTLTCLQCAKPGMEITIAEK